MLQSLRNWAGGWVAGIFILLIAASFAVWGINDVFINRASNVVATIGEEEITTQDFSNARENQLRALQAQYRRRLTPKEAETYGINRQVLARLVGTASINEHARDMQLGVPDDAVVKEVQSDRNFQDTSGKFNNAVFQEALRQRGLTERRFIENRKSDVIRNQITDAMLSQVAIPETMIKMLNEFADETRKVEYFTLKQKTDIKIKEPTDGQLESFYRANIADYTAPELRKVGVVILDPIQIAKSMTIPDADLKQEFEATKQRFEQPERRRVQRITFKDDAAAQKALAGLEKKTSFVDVAKEAGFTEQEIDLGNVVPRQISDANIREAAFKLEQGKTSGIIKTGLGPALIKVTAIEAGVAADYETAKDQVRNSLASRRAAKQVNTIYDAIQEDLGGGADIKQAAGNQSVKYIEVPAVDRSGNDADGKAIEALAGKTAVLTALFGNEPGNEIEPIEISRGSYAFAEVLKITKKRERPLKEVRERAIKEYKQTERNTALATRAKELTEKANNGTSIAEIAKSVAAELKTTHAFKRTAKVEGLPQSVVTQAFSIPEKRAAYASGDTTDERVIFRVVDIAKPKVLTPITKQTITTNLERSRTNDLLAEYIGGLQAKYNVKINETVFGQASGSIPYPSSNGGGRGS